MTQASQLSRRIAAALGRRQGRGRAVDDLSDHLLRDIGITTGSARRRVSDSLFFRLTV